MKIFLDTASLPEIVWAAGAGLIDGVTTNPSLLAQEDSETDPRDHLSEIARSVSGPVGAEVVAVDADGMYRDGRDLAKVADSIIVMVPMLEDGIVATRRLWSDVMRVCTPLVLTAPHALLTPKSGARYVSPFVGRLEDIGQDGVSVVAQTREIFMQYGLDF